MTELGYAVRRVAFDATPAISGETGVARYCVELLRAADDPRFAMRPFAIGRGGQRPPNGTRQFREPLRSTQLLWRTLGRPTVNRYAGQVDLVHATDLEPPPSVVPLVMTLHDTAALDLPDLHSSRQHQQQARQLRAALQADMVLAVSRATAASAVAKGVAPERVLVTPLGVSKLPPPTPPLVDGPYLLVVGELAARKNLPLLIGAFRRSEVVVRRRVKLILAGPDGHGSQVARAALGGCVHALGRVSPAQLAALYRDAEGLCFPSLGEGFGLPVLEAMAAGLPVIASDLPVLHELTAGNAVHVAPTDATGWTAAIDALLANPSDAVGLSRAAKERSARYTWEATVEATYRGYEAALARDTPRGGAAQRVSSAIRAALPSRR